MVVTNREDLTADWLILELQRRGARYIRFNTEDYPQRVALDWTPTDAVLRVGASEMAAGDLDAVWFRRPVRPRLRPGLTPAEAEWATREAAEALDGFWRTLKTRWVSEPSAIRMADSKPRQLADAPALGWEIPDTEITNSPTRVSALASRSPAGIVCKPLRGGRVRQSGGSLFFTTVVDPVTVEHLRDEPYLFQARVPKRYDIRVTVIGQEAFATRIEPRAGLTPDVDWRRTPQTSLRFTRERLPDEVSERCVSTVEHYGLSFGAIDLARRQDGGYTFFELNPNGQWAFIEQATGQPLRAKLADQLGA